MSKNTVDIDYAEKSVPQSERRSLATMFMIMLGFTFFSASMWVGQELADGLDFSGFVISLILGGVTMLYTAAHLGEGNRNKTLHITIPEDLDYSGVFDPILKEYTTDYILKRVKTTNMGSLFKLTYDLTLRDPAKEKALIDDLRCRNGNLEISVSYQETNTAGL